MEETVTVWEESRRIDTQNQPSRGVPFKQARPTLTLTGMLAATEKAALAKR